MSRAWFLWRGMVAGFADVRDGKGALQGGELLEAPAMDALLAAPAMMAANALSQTMPDWTKDNNTAFMVGKGLALAVFGAPEVTKEFEALGDDLAHDLRDMVRDKLSRVAWQLNQQDLQQLVDTWVR